MKKTPHSEPIDVEERARRYLAKLPGAVAGSRGHDATFRAACVLRVGFDLPPDAAVRLLLEWNQTCAPPWSPTEIERKIAQAERERDNEPAQIGKLAGKPAATAARPGAGQAPSKSHPARKPDEDMRDDVFDTRQSASVAADAYAGLLIAALSSFDKGGYTGAGGKYEPAGIVHRGVAPEIEIDPSDSWAEPPQVATTEAAPAGAQEAADKYANVRAIYGSKRALWDAIVRAERKLMRDFRAEHNRGCNMPDTVWLDSRVIAELPGEIEGMQVQGRDIPGVVDLGWTRRKP